VQNEISNNEKLIFTNYGSPNYHVQVHVHVWVRHAITYLIISVLHGFLQSVDAGGSESDEDGLCEYEKQRLRKIKENRAFLASLNLDTAKEDLKALTQKQVKVCQRCLVQLGIHRVYLKGKSWNHAATLYNILQIQLCGVTSPI
jgi:hypothetical protein